MKIFLFSKIHMYSTKKIETFYRLACNFCGVKHQECTCCCTGGCDTVCPLLQASKVF